MKMKERTKLGHYEIIPAIGKGRMDEIYLAEDAELKSLFAVKVLFSGSCRKKDGKRRLVQEA